MKRLSVIGLGLIMMGFIVHGCVHQPSGQADIGWIVLLDGSNLDNWTRTGNANWRILDGVAQADQGNGHLVSKNSYTDFQLRAEFWVDADGNSGIHFRCADPQKPGSATCYEVNISTNAPMQNMARAPSSMSPRYRPCLKPAAAGTQRRSPPKVRGSPSYSTASAPPMFRTPSTHVDRSRFSTQAVS